MRKENQSASATPVSAVVAYIKDHRATFAYHHVATAMLSFAYYGASACGAQGGGAQRDARQVSAMYLFVVNIIGLGLGPTVIALLTDRVFHNDNMLRYSLMIATTGAYLVSALLWWLGLKPFRRTVDHAEASRQPTEAVGV